MKKIIVFVLILSMLFSYGCAGNNTEKNNDGKTVTVTDHNGDTVTLPKGIERIAVCDIYPLPSVLTIFLDSAEKIVAMSPTSMSAAQNGLLSELYPEILNADTSAISGTDVNVEELMMLDPQVVFYNASNTQLGDTLKRAGFNAVGVSTDKWDYNAVETLKHWIELFSEIFPESTDKQTELVEKYSEEYMKLVRERTENLTEKERKKVLFLYQYSENTIVTSGQKLFGQWFCDKIGAVNAAQELKEGGSVKITLEQAYSWDPDVILMTNFTTASPDDIYNNTVGNYDWSGITAVRDKRVYKMPLGMYRSATPGIDTPITILWLAKTVYPDLFADIDITEKTVEYYDQVFGVQLTSKQAESIFKPVSRAGKIDF